MPQEEYHPPTITFGDTELKSVQQFTFLSCTISSDAMIDKEIDNRLAKANTTFGRLYKNLWNKKSLKRKTRSAFTELLHSLLSSMAPRPGSHIAATSKSSRVSIVVYGVSIGNKGMPPSISIKNKGLERKWRLSPLGRIPDGSGDVIEHDIIQDGGLIYR